MFRLLLLLLALGTAFAGEPFEDHDKAHGRPQLARLGTIGDRPPLESTLVVHVHADGVIVIDGKETTLDGLSARLAALYEAQREPAVLLRADERLPWQAMQWPRPPTRYAPRFHSAERCDCGSKRPGVKKIARHTASAACVS